MLEVSGQGGGGIVANSLRISHTSQLTVFLYIDLLLMDMYVCHAQEYSPTHVL